ncbi:PDR/VanB family oxidoreductase [Yaniella flava]|uniref:PDR/VanB family oxidoreductase n=1 Tax=Yaniella flava TaxID=287930 RepID=A0ABP5GHY5_9MICC
MKPPKNAIQVRVEEVADVAEHIKRFRFAPVDNIELPVFSPGSNITVNMDGDERRIKNQYSLISSPEARDAYEISVLHVDDSRGGSEFMHRAVSPGDTLWINPPNNEFAIYDLAKKHLLIAGGIGITPFMPMTAQLAARDADFELHYAMRSKNRAAYADELREAIPEQLYTYQSSLGQRIQFNELLDDQPLGTHLYVCGPERMIDDVLEIARQAGWPDEDLHWEKFVGPPPGDPFDVTLAESDMEVHVGAEESILEAVEQAGVEPDFGCRGGVCGRCETTVVNVDGDIIHNDEFLTDDERASGEQIMICMSRFKGKDLTLKL